MDYYVVYYRVLAASSGDVWSHGIEKAKKYKKTLTKRITVPKEIDTFIEELTKGNAPVPIGWNLYKVLDYSVREVTETTIIRKRVINPE